MVISQSVPAVSFTNYTIGSQTGQPAKNFNLFFRLFKILSNYGAKM